jgi:hypothetical protein
VDGDETPKQHKHISDDTKGDDDETASQRRLIWTKADLLDHANETEPKALTPLLVYSSRVDHLRDGLAVEIYRLHRSASRAR